MADKARRDNEELDSRGVPPDATPTANDAPMPKEETPKMGEFPVPGADPNVLDHPNEPRGTTTGVADTSSRIDTGVTPDKPVAQMPGVGAARTASGPGAGAAEGPGGGSSSAASGDGTGGVPIAPNSAMTTEMPPAPEDFGDAMRRELANAWRALENSLNTEPPSTGDVVAFDHRTQRGYIQEAFNNVKLAMEQMGQQAP